MSEVSIDNSLSISLYPPTNNIFNKDTKDRFWALVCSRQAGSCWNWDGCLSKSGYGQFNYYKTSSAHRISWIMHYGPIPPGKLVLHKCDNKRCVNPMHLYLGNHSRNMLDWVDRSPNARKGKRISTFSIPDANTMKQLYLSGKTYKDISGKYNVDTKTVWNIVNNITTHFRGE